MTVFLLLFFLPTHAFKFASLQTIIAAPNLSINATPSSTRAFWMRQANEALLSQSPCPFSAFGSVIVNHTEPGMGELVCTGVNTKRQMGNPTLHGEIAAINNCTAILTDPDGLHKLSPSQALAAFAQLSLYTNAESCPMCASAIRWSNLREYIYGTSIDRLIENGWGQCRISSIDIFRESFDLPGPARLIGEVLTNETDPYFSWQFNPAYPCPSGCARTASGSCGPS
ncbi:guanine deaminase [Mycena amicta]|nr:guanine deaminase [Mycena amicta]